MDTKPLKLSAHQALNKQFADEVMGCHVEIIDRFGITLICGCRVRGPTEIEWPGAHDWGHITQYDDMFGGRTLIDYVQILGAPLVRNILDAHLVALRTGIP